jgi:Tfp pilus assembly protein PilN
MRRIADFNFASDRRGYPFLAWLLLLCGSVAQIVIADRYAAAEEAHAVAERRIARLERRLAPVAAVAPATQKSALAERRQTPTFPWNEALTALEAAIDRDIALLALESDAAAGTTRLSGEARDIDDILAFAERLRASPAVRRALLAAHDTRQTPAGAAIGFVLQIEWQRASAPASPDRAAAKGDAR